MAVNSTELDIVIKAIDDASATLKQIAANSVSSNQQVAESSDKASRSFFQLTGAVALADAAYGALVEGYDKVKDFFAESISASMEQDAAYQ